MPKLLKTRDLGLVDDVFEIFDDFTSIVTADLWTITEAAGSVAVDADGANGLCVITCAAADNDDQLINTGEFFRVKANRSIYAKAKLNVTETAAAAAYAFGFCNAPTNIVPIPDDATALAVMTDAILFYKLETDTVWSLHTELGSASTTTASNLDIPANGTDIDVELIGQMKSPTELSVTCRVDGEQLCDANGYKIEHILTLGTSAEMALVAVAKSAGAAEVLTLDYVYAAQNR